MAQACGVPRHQADKVIGKVFTKHPGHLAQELGGAGVTLFALAAGCGYDLEVVVRDEIHRLETTDPEKFRNRNAQNRADGTGV